MPSLNNGSFTVFINEPEFDYLKWLVLQKRKIETGGDLFGLWQNENTAVVQFILGPGKGCKRTTTSFHQDLDYLEQVGGYLTSSQGLCNIGEWHSHHTLGLAKPSYGDQQTVWNNISSVAGGRFLLFIANIRGKESVNVGCFLFNASKRNMTKGQFKFLPGKSPFRLTMLERAQLLTTKAETEQDWKTFEKQSVEIHRSSASNKSTTNDEHLCEAQNEKKPLLPSSSDKRLCHKFTRSSRFCWAVTIGAAIVVIILVVVLSKHI